MRLNSHTIAAFLLLSLASAVAAAPKEHVPDYADGKIAHVPGSDVAKDPLAIDASGLSSSKDVTDRRTTSGDAPLDGKDGRPHDGPFIETAAERDRKLAKDKGDDELSSAGKKPGKDTGYGPDWPEHNDGVMDDRYRDGPKEGTRGTEGGVSEKTRDKQLGPAAGKTPEEPKEAPPLPQSEQEKLTESEKSKGSYKSDNTEDKESSSDDFGGLKKPEDLPSTPHDIPHPLPNSGSTKDDLGKQGTEYSAVDDGTDSSIIHPLHSFVLSLTMIIFAEIGDKTFLVAALMAMKHPPLLVLSAAFPALLTMTILSAVLGHALPSLLPVRLTSFLAAILFFVFGIKLLREGLAMQPDEGVGEEMREVEMELEEKEQLARKMGRRRSSISPYMLEAARDGRKARANSRLPAPPDSPPSSSSSRSPSPSQTSNMTSMLSGVNNLFSLLFSPAWVQTFVMTFLGEWGDRSQIATIAMAAGQDYWWVTTGALVGHFGCTVLAVIGGRAIAGRVSMRVVTLGGAIAFLAFGVVYLAESIYYRNSA